MGTSIKLPLSLIKIANKDQDLKPLLKQIRSVSLFQLNDQSNLFQKAKLDLFKTLNQSPTDNLLSMNSEGSLVHLTMYEQKDKRAALLITTEDESDIVLIDIKLKVMKEEAVDLLAPLVSSEKNREAMKRFAKEKTINIL